MQLEVTTTQGPIRGRERQGVALFAGIPYAAPPVGPRRWAPPQPAEPWTAVRDAQRFGPAAPQLPGDGMTNSAPVVWDEDCLTLNVCTPAADDAARPVMVWIHGGAYRHGTGATPWYDGTSFASRGDVVVVTINYRLGALGFCRVPGAATGGLNGTLDQIAALEWVRDNISRFGGDPGRVTIAGESAGAFSVSTLTAMERARGLFGRAIAQSGAGHHVLPTEAADAVAEVFLDELGATDLEQARAATPLEILEAQTRTEARAASVIGRVQQPFYPSVHPELLTARPIDLMAAGAGAEVAMLAGTNGDESTLFGMTMVPEGRLHRLMAHYVDPPDDLLAMYAAQHPGAGAPQLATRLTTDYMFRIPAVRLAEARHAHGAATWMYLFDWKSRALDGALGATHALEIPFMFNTLDRPGVDLFLGTDNLPTDLAGVMHAAWIAFIRDGAPVTDALGAWPTYDPAERAVMELSDATGVRLDPDGVARAAWAGLR